jgi:hypothetical protein
MRGGIRATIARDAFEVGHSDILDWIGQTLTRTEDDDVENRDHRPQKQHRPRYEEPIASRLRRELMVIGEAVSLDPSGSRWTGC